MVPILAVYFLMTMRVVAIEPDTVLIATAVGSEATIVEKYRIDPIGIVVMKGDLLGLGHSHGEKSDDDQQSRRRPLEFLLTFPLDRSLKSSCLCSFDPRNLVNFWKI